MFCQVNHVIVNLFLLGWAAEMEMYNQANEGKEFRPPSEGRGEPREGRDESREGRDRLRSPSPARSPKRSPPRSPLRSR